ncbi:MAG: IS21 family transposase [Thermoanaerobacterium thermosaccharolyticum]
MIISVNLYQKIREMYTVHQMSQRAIARELKISRNTVRKYCKGDNVPWERKEYSREPDVLTPDVIDFIRQCIEEDETEGIKKQQHTARRIYHRLVEEKGFKGGESTVRLAVQRLKDEIPKAFVPLDFDPGEAAQVDWGEATVYLDNTKVTINLFCMRLCYSCDIFVMAFYRQNEESFLEGNVKAFEHFGGVPHKLIFDNARVAVKEGFGTYAKPQARYHALSAHYAFKMEFCNPGKGNEKGLVENLVGWVRRNILVPVPRVKNINELNQVLLANCLKYRSHQIRGREQTVGQMYEMDKSLLYALPKYVFDSSKSISADVDEYSTVRFDRNNYSVPVKYVGKSVSIKAYGNILNIFYRGQEIAQHNRNYGSNKTTYKLEHYIDLLEQKPRAVFNAKPVKDHVKKELLEWGQILPGGARDMVKVLRLCVDYGSDKLLEIKQQIPAGVTPTVDLIRSYLMERSTPVKSAQKIIDTVKVEEVDLSIYDRQYGVAQ